MSRIKTIDDDDDNPERWLVSYADFITLLFAFFVVMYSISSVNQGKYRSFTSAIGTAFTGSNAHLKLKGVSNSQDESNQKNQNGSIIKPLPLADLYNQKKHRERESMTAIKVDLSSKLSPFVSQGKVSLSQNNRGIVININDSLLFKPGSAELAPAAIGILTDISLMLNSNDRLIQVEGHTDNNAIHNAIFFSNWELSAVRASSVVRMLIETGIAENRLSATGFGSTRPINENDSELGRARNRRVSILILYESINDLQNQDRSDLELGAQSNPSPTPH